MLQLTPVQDAVAALVSGHARADIHALLGRGDAVVRELTAVLSIVRRRFDWLLLLLDCFSFHRAAGRRETMGDLRACVIVVA